MPATHRLRVKLNAGAWQTGGVVAALGDTVALSPDNTVGVTSYRYEIFDYPPGFACPAGWSTDGNSVYYSTAATPPDFALDAVEWGKYALRLTVNGGVSEVIVGKSTRVQADPLLIDEETAIKVESALGVGGLMQRERNQFGGVDWTRAYNEDIRALEAAAAGVSANAADWKESVWVATTAALPAYTRVGNVLTANANGALPAIDGETLTVGTRRLLLWHGAAGADNGTYDVTAVGDAGNPFVLTRTVDGAGNTEAFTSEAHVPIMAGTAHAGKTFRLVTDDPITMNVTALTFVAATGLPDGSAVGQVPRWDGTTWLAGALNLAAAAAVTGILAVANGGTGLAALGAANTVLKVKSDGTVNEYGKLTTANLDAAAGILGSQLSATAGIVGTQLSASAAIAATQLAAGAAGTVLIGGASNSFSATPTVTSVLHGASADAGFTVAAAAGTWGRSVAAPGLTQSACADDSAPQSITITPQAPFATASGANRTPGSLIVALAAPTNSGTTEAFFRIHRSGTVHVAMGPYAAAPTSFSGIYLGPGVVPSATNYCFLASSTDTYLNAPSAAGTVHLLAGNTARLSISPTAATCLVASWLFANSVTPQVAQSARTSDAAPVNFTIAAQSAWASSTGANVHGGHLLLRGGAEKGAAAGKKGGVRLQLNGTNETMTEATEIAIGQRVVALCRGSDLTPTQMPAGTGDRVVYIENSATVRSTGTPVGGGMLEVVAGDMFVINEAGVRNQIN